MSHETQINLEKTTVTLELRNLHICKTIDANHDVHVKISNDVQAADINIIIWL